MTNVQAEEASGGLRTPAFLERIRDALRDAPALDRSSQVPTWIGLAFVVLGFAVLAFGWGRVAGLAAVPLQVPYVISAGCFGLALIVLGTGVIAIQARRREAADREEVIAELARVVRELERVMGGSPDGT